MVKKLALLTNMAIYLGFTCILASSSAFATDQRRLVYNGRLLDNTGTPVNGNVQFDLQITDTLGTCVLWDESQTITVTNGVFYVQMGSGAINYDGGGTGKLDTIFAQGSAINCKSGVPAASVTPAVTDNRNLAITFNTGSGWQALPTQVAISTVPYSLLAENSTKFGGYPLSGAPINGQTLVYNSGTQQWVPTTLATGGTVTNVATGTGLTGGPITATGTISLANIANNQLLANTSGGAAAPTGTSLSALIDGAIGNSQGSVLYRGAGGWTALAPGVNGQFLQTTGAGSNPQWAAAGAGSVTGVTASGPLASSGGTTPNISLSGVVPVANGGTNSSAALGNNQIMISSGGKIVEGGALTNGQLMIGSTGAAPVAGTITGTANEINVATGAGSITLSTPQAISTTASPTFAGMTISGLGTGAVSSTAGVLSAGTLSVGNGGTGTTSFGANRMIMANGTGSALTVDACASGNVLEFNGTTWACTSTSSLTSGTDFQQGGNSFGATATLGTKDSNSLSIITNNTPAMTILSNGRIGMGTPTPNSAVDMGGGTLSFNGSSGATVVGAGDGSITMVAAGGGINLNYGLIGIGVSNNITLTSFGNAANSIKLKNGATTVMTLNQGFVGIGTTTPAVPLDLSGTFAAEGIAAPAVSTAGQGRIYFDSTSNQFMVSQNGGAYTNLVGGGSGTVTNVATGSGLTGGPITTTGTISLANINNNQLLANTSGSAGTPTGTSLTSLIDSAIGNTQGSILYRGAGGWSALAPGTTGQVLQTQGAGANPQWATGSTGTVTGVTASAPLASSGGATPNLSLTGVVPVANGGTNSSAALANNQMMVSSGGKIVEAGALSNGQIFIGSTGATPVAGTIAGTANEISVATGAGTITLSTPQAINTAASPTFAGMTLSGLGTGAVSSSAGVLSAGTLSVGNGGTGATSFTANRMIMANGTGSALTVDACASGNVLEFNGTTWACTSASSLTGGTDFQQGGNSFGATGTLGTKDSNSLNVITNNVTRMTFDTSGNVAVNKATPAAGMDVLANSSNPIAGQFVSSVTNVGNNGVIGTVSPVHTTNVGITDAAGSFSNTTKIASGMSNAGVEQGAAISDLRNLSTTGDSGTASSLMGLQLTYGHFNSDNSATPQTTTAYGINIVPYHMTGSINTMFDIYLNTDQTGGTVTNRWGIYQVNTANNYLAGKLALGSSGFTPATTLDVAGTIAEEGIAAPAVSSAGQGRIYFDSTSNTFKVSQNGGAYTNLLGGGSGTVTNVATGSGLTGGPITTTGTISLANINNNQLLANTSGSAAAPMGTSLSALMDSAIGSTQGSVIYRGAAGWSALTPGTSGQFLQTQGASANPQWATPTGGGTVTSVAASAPLASSGGTTPNISLTGTVAVANGGTGATSFGANRMVMANGTGSALTVDACASGNVLQYNGTSWACTSTSSLTSGTDFQQGGNSFGAAANLGTNDANVLNLKTNGSTAVTISTTGNVGVGAAPTYKLDSTGDVNTSTLYRIGGNPAVSMNSTWETVYVGAAMPASPGPDSTAVGVGAMPNATGGSNTFVGTSSGGSSSTGISANNNTGLGFGAGEFLSSGAGNILIGELAANNLSSGSNNTIVGTGSANTLGTGSNNILIGSGVDVALAGTSNTLNIGNLVYGDLTNKYIGVNVTPATALDVNGAFSQRGMAAPAVSSAGQGRIYFDSTSNTFKVSQNGGAYANLVGGGSGTVTNVATGSGLTGGPITTTGTISLANVNNNQLLANTSGSAAAPTGTSLTALIDSALGNTQGSVLYRGAAGWSVLGPGTSGQVLQTQGAGANPQWAAAGGSGTVTSVATGTGLTGGPISTTGTVSLASIANNTILANTSGSLAAPVATSQTTLLDTIGSTSGMMMYRGAGSWTSLAIGSTGQFLTVSAGGVPQWSTTVNDSVLQTQANNTILANTSGVLAAPSPVSMSALIDSTMGSTQGYMLYRAAGNWSPLAIGTTGQFLTVSAGGVPQWSSTVSDTALQTQANNTILANTSGSLAAPTATTMSSLLDSTLGNTEGSVIYRAAGNWTLLNPGTSGQFLQTQGAGNVPQWANGNSGTVTNVATGSGLTGGPISTTGTISLANINNNNLLANTSGSAGAPTGTTLTALIDGAISNTQGSVLYRGAAGWAALGPGTSGQVLQTQGAGLNPQWAAVSGGSGTVTNVATGTGLTGGPISTTGTISLASIANNTILANTSGSLAAPVATSQTTLLDTIGNTSGTMLFRGAASWTPLVIGTSGQFLTVSVSGAPQWSSTVNDSSLQSQANNTILANTSGSLAAPSATTMTALLDSTMGNTEGSIMYRGAANWALLAPGTSGQFLQTQGAGMVPQWAAAGGSGTVTSVATGTGLTGGPITATGTISLANISNNNLLANTSGSTGSPTGTTLTALIDSSFSNSQGSILYRGPAGWLALAPGTSGQFLETQGIGMNPTWAAASGGGLNVPNGSSGGIPYYSAGNAISSSATLAAGAIVVGGGMGVAPSTVSIPTGALVMGNTTGTGLTTLSPLTGGVVVGNTSNNGFTMVSSATVGAPLLSGGGASTPTYGALNLAGGASIVTGTLGVLNGGTGTTAYLANRMVIVNGTGNGFTNDACISGQVLQYNGTNWACTAMTGSQWTTSSPYMYYNGGNNVGIGTTTPGTALDVAGAFSLRGMSAPTTAPAGQGRMYFDSTLNEFMISQNGSAYAPLGSGGGGTVTNVATGTGLTGGPITATGTISLASISNNTLLANISGLAAAPTSTTLSNLIDSSMGSTVGSILYRNTTGWTTLGPGTSGQVLQTNGMGFPPQWSSSGGGGVTNVTASAPLSSSGGTTPNISLTGIVGVSNGGTGSSLYAANRILMTNGSGSAFTYDSCSAGNTLQFNGTSWTCVSGGAGSYFQQGGNAFGTAATLGTTDSNILNFETGGTTQMTLLTNGYLGIGTPTPNFALDVEAGSNTFAQFGNSMPVYMFDPIVGSGTQTQTALTDGGGGKFTGVGFNLYYTGGSNFNFGQGSTSNYGAVMALDPVAGILSIGVTPTPGAANALATTDSAMTVTSAGLIGIGATTPRGRLDVAGTILGAPGVSNSTGTIDFSTGNTQYTTNSCGSYQLNNLKDGGSFSFVVKGGTSALCSFTAYSDAGLTPLTVHTPPGFGATTTGTHTVFSFMVVGTDMYVAWTPGY